jgi:hypothetical protein
MKIIEIKKYQKKINRGNLKVVNGIQIKQVATRVATVVTRVDYFTQD